MRFAQLFLLNKIKFLILMSRKKRHTAGLIRNSFFIMSLRPELDSGSTRNPLTQPVIAGLTRNPLIISNIFSWDPASSAG